MSQSSSLRARRSASRVLAAAALTAVALAAHLQARAQVGPPASSAVARTPSPTRYLIQVKAPGMETADVASRAASERVAMDALEPRLAALGVTQKRRLRAQAAYAAELSSEQVAALRRDPNVAVVERDLPRYLAANTPPYMEGFSKPSKAPMALNQRVPYGITATQAAQVAATDGAASGMTVCIIDSGYDRRHPDLAGNTQITGSNDPKGTRWWYNDNDGHGTHVAGTIAAINNPDTGVVGVWPNGKIKLHILKAFDYGRWLYSSELIDAADACVAAGAKVINMSLGAPFSLETERAGFERIANSGVLLVAAAGNFGDKSVLYPAGYPSVVSVAAVDMWNQHASYSQYNPDVEWSAPGSDVLSTLPLGFGREPTLIVDGKTQPAPRGVEDSTQKASVSGPLADFGKGDKVDPAMAGKICVASHAPDQMDVAKLAVNCQKSKGLGLIITNTKRGTQYAYVWEMPGEPAITIPVVTYSNTQGKTLRTMLGKTAQLSVKPADYGYYNGTSMATPHAAAVAALVWSHFPTCTAAQIRSVITRTAKDLGAPGRDDETGAGLVQAKAAYDALAARGCGG